MGSKHLPKPGDTIYVSDRKQRNYCYDLVAPYGEEFEPDFTPFALPDKILAMGVFEGRYMTDCSGEFPEFWFEHARQSAVPDPSLNYFGVKSRQPLSVWREKGWVFEPDPRGWFQWYCRYTMGRRLPEIDALQIKRWRSFKRHAAQVKAHCEPGDCSCRKKQRQALLQWAYDPFI